MALKVGTKIGPYVIGGPIGAGGMGEVYRVRDTKLNREVALKVLPAAFANDPARMARFQREAEVLASLNHPSIAAIHGLEESSGVRALVMELVEGPTLAERIAQGPILLEEALAIARQIAEALEYAHEKGIIHRDLKPANVKITPEGNVKVLDFGLAKAAEVTAPMVSPADSPTLSLGATQGGVILGTAAYMSPEQARGKGVDKRADIWAFGAVLYEMLNGRPVFEGETVSDMLAAVIKTEPNWDLLPAGVPATIVKLLRRCLEKDPKLRLRDIGDARIEIADAMAVPATVPASGVSEVLPPATERRMLLRPALLAVAAIVVLLALFVSFWLGGRRVAQSPRWSGDLVGGSTVALGPRMSPDGHTLAFQAMVDNLTQVAVLNPDSGNWNVLTHDRSHGIVGEIAWSGDGSKLYFDRKLAKPEGIYTVPSLGGDERLVLEDAEYPEVVPDGSLLVCRLDPDRREQVYHFWPETGRLQALGAWLPKDTATSSIRVFPDGNEAVFFGSASGNDTLAHLYALDISSGRVRQLAPQLPMRQTSYWFPLAVTPDNRSVLIDLPAGNLHQVVALPRSGSGPVQVLMTVTTGPWLMDAGPNGSLYLDQVERPLEVLRFPVTGGLPEIVASSETYSTESGLMEPVEFPDGRFLLPTALSDRARLLIGKPGGNFFPLVDSTEETGPLAALLPDSEVAFIAGRGSDKTIAIASAREGRIIRRLQGAKGQQPTGLAASVDGKTLYYVVSGSVWAIPTADGTPRKVCSGDGVAVDPNGQDLIVNLNEKAGVRLVRVALSSAPGQDIRVQGELPIDPIPIGGNSVRKDGKILVGVAPRDSWFFGLAILDAATGKLTRVAVNYTGDIFHSAWANDGRILAMGGLMRARIWRFRPVR
jgi:Tol biopolymer transport system component